jgi:hypothetical protein
MAALSGCAHRFRFHRFESHEHPQPARIHSMKGAHAVGSKRAFPLMNADIVFCGAWYFLLTPWKWRLAAIVIDCAVVALGFAAFGETFVLVGIGYFLVGDGLFRGARIGKRFVGIKVIESRHGCPCTILQDLIGYGTIVVRRLPLSDAEIEALREELREFRDPAIAKRLALQKDRDDKAAASRN